MAVMLLVETNQGDVVAVRFPDADAARDWEDAHPEVEAHGVARVLTRTEAIRLTKP